LKKQVLLLFLILLFPLAFAEQKITFGELGHTGFFAENLKKCFEIEFLANFDDPQVLPSISLKTSIAGNFRKNTFLTAQVNDHEIGTINESNFVPLESEGLFSTGWVRIEFSKKILEEKNTLSLCLLPIEENTKIWVSPDSFFEWGKRPALLAEKSFEMTIDREPVAGEDLTVTLFVRNFGSKEKKVTVTYRKKELEETAPWVRFLTGATEWTASVPSCVKWATKECTLPGEKVFSYKVRINRIGQLTLFPAILAYTNNFNEKITVQSNWLPIDVKAPAIIIQPVIELKKTVFSKGEQINFNIITKNTGRLGAPKAILTVHSPDLVLKESRVSLPPLSASETVQNTFSATSNDAGEFRIFCKIHVEEYGLFYDCLPVTVVVEEERVSKEFFGAILLALLAILVFLAFYFKK
jgi:hypothetical protein